MPFDGHEVSRTLVPRPPTRAPVGRWAPLADRLRSLLPGNPCKHHTRPLSPERPDAVAEIVAVHLLRAARALIEAEGVWGQGTYQTPGGRRCAVGALRATVARAGQRESRARKEANALLLAVARERGFASVELMNDGSSHADVLAAFDDAARRAARR